MNLNFESVAPYLHDPLVLIGFFLFLFFGTTRLLIKKNVIPPLPPGLGYRLIHRLFLYGFILGLLIIGLGFGLKYRELPKAEQRRAVQLLRNELVNNQETAKKLAANAETLLGVFKNASEAARIDKRGILSILFPKANLRSDHGPPTALELANEAINTIRDRGLHQNEREMAVLTATARTIAATVNRTMSTVDSLTDPEHTRFVIHEEMYQTHLALLKQVTVIDLTSIQAGYSELNSLRTNYDIVVRAIREYLSTLSKFLGQENRTIDRRVVTELLTAERNAMVLIHSYTPQIIKVLSELDGRIKELSLP